MAEKASAVERALKAQQDLEELREAAIDELLASRAAVDDNLKTLGYSEGGKPKAKHRVGAKHCTVCNLDGHDGRAHRNQGKNKKPFAKDEIEASTE